jgi:hypothetical protein
MEASSDRFSIGTMTCDVVSDGTFTYHEPGTTFFASPARSELGEALRQAGIRSKTGRSW